MDTEAIEDLSDDESDVPPQYEDSEEDEDKVDEREIDEEGNIVGLVNDDVGKKEKHRKKRRHHQLEEEDIALIEENLGVRLKKRFRRIKVFSSDEDEAEEGIGDAIRNDIFGDDDDDNSQDRHEEAPLLDSPNFDVDDEVSEESDFIVSDDDDGAATRQPHKRRKPRDAGLAQVQEIFGTDFDFNEIRKYNEDYEDDELDDYFDHDEEEYAEGYTRSRQKKMKKMNKFKSIYDVIDPETLERGFYTDVDAKIRDQDIPERFQLRSIQVRPVDEANNDLTEEAEWIYKHAFIDSTISVQDVTGDGSSDSFGGSRKPASCVANIRSVLEFIRNEHFDVPYIAFYRKEYTEPHLKIHDIFRIYHWDEKWAQLTTRKNNLKRLFKKMQTYQYEKLSAETDKPLSDARPLPEAQIEKIDSIQNLDELQDIYFHFLLHYGKDIPNMQNSLKLRQMRNKGEEDEEEKKVLTSELKQASRKDRYTVCARAGLGNLADKFGLTPTQFGENLRDNYQRHETEQYPTEPSQLAKEFISSQFPTSESVLEGARYMVAKQLAREPLVRQCVRQVFMERAMITARPTKKGRKEIDEQHPCFKMKYLLDKPIKTFTNCQFLILCNAEKDGLITIKMHIDKVKPIIGQTYYEETKNLYFRDEFSHLVQEWNKQRCEVIKFMLDNLLYPEMVNEMRSKLLEEAKEGIKEKCALKIRDYLSIAGYQIEENENEEEHTGVISMAIAYSEDRNLAAFAAIVDGTGEFQDYLKLSNIRNRNRNIQKNEPKQLSDDMKRIKEFIKDKKPHIIVIGVTDRFATGLQQDIKSIISEFESEGLDINPAVEVIDNELAVLYSATNRANTAFREYPSELRQAISLARRVQDPLLEFSQLCSVDEDILCLKLHPLQDEVEKDELLESLYEEFIFRTCEVGVDVNHAIAHPHTANVVQFVSGLGPRKSAHLLKVLEQKQGRLENRSNLVTDCRLGPKVFINCAGFIKIDTKSLEDSSSYIEVLDGLRVHPETYDWARKMAVDALEYDESMDENNPSDNNPTIALGEILLSPERLKDLDLDAFAVELERQGMGKRGITLYDIRNELSARYKDFRHPYRPPTIDQRFQMVTKEQPSAFTEGKLVTCQVFGIAYRKLNEESVAKADHNKDLTTNLWTCCFCHQNNFVDLNSVWEHVDTRECPGKPVGVKTRFENGLTGFISLDKLSDKQVLNPLERVKIGMTIHCRILKLDVERFQLDLSTKGSDLRDENRSLQLQNDDFYDYDAEVDDKNKLEQKNKENNRTAYIKRVIAHPSFHNIDFKRAEQLMMNMDNGEAIIRPSSKGSNHLTVTWKVFKGICAHIDVLEEKKENSFSLGKLLWIGQEEFEDLDEIIARFIQPMASNANDLITHKYFREDSSRDKIDEALKQAKKATPSRIPYFITADKTLPGKFVISYLPRTKPKHEYTTVTPDGFRYRKQMFNTVNYLLKWFKEHFQDPAYLAQRAMLPPSSSTSNKSTTPTNRPMRTPGRHTPRTPKSTPLPRTPHTPSMPYITPDAYKSINQVSKSPAAAMLPPRTPPARNLMRMQRKTQK